ncbi:MAG: TonB-dependent receptor plug domain-containing protein, partial [Balneola sp.]
MVISIGINAQGVIYGTVTDAGTGETIPGATVLIEEINRGIATDADGKYRLTGVPSGDYKVTFSFVGFKSLTLDVQVGSSEVLLNANLEATAIGLDELVVSGYAITPKRELTGSISSVTSKDIQDVSLQNTQSILQGRAAGVTVSATSGNPGAAFKVQIRGNGSINAVSEPLYIVDGVQIDLGNTSGLTSTTPLNAINPNDIESLEVLKDAAAAAIYGSQAASGVVIITTKSGTSGATRVNAKVERGVRSLARNVDYINSDQYVEYMGEASALNFGIDPTEGYTSPFAG